jgi:hypothetical protein
VGRQDGGQGWRDDRITGNRHKEDEATAARDDRRMIGRPFQKGKL